MLAKLSNTSTLPELVEFTSDGLSPYSDATLAEAVTSSLGLRWNTTTDSFQIKTKVKVRSYTKGDCLAT